MVRIEIKWADKWDWEVEIGVEKADRDIPSSHARINMYTRLSVPRRIRSEWERESEYAHRNGEKYLLVTQYSKVVSSVNTVIAEKIRDTKKTICKMKEE